MSAGEGDELMRRDCGRKAWSIYTPGPRSCPPHVAGMRHEGSHAMLECTCLRLSPSSTVNHGLSILRTREAANGVRGVEVAATASPA